jgi:hypothetical protein
MKTFPFPQDDISQCPICGSAKEGEATFIPIAGTSDGENMEACVVHQRCLTESLKYFPASSAIMGLAKHDYKKSP